MKYLITLLILINLSCNSIEKESNKDHAEYFVSISTFVADFKDQHNKLSDKCTAILNNLYSDSFRNTDTIGLSLLLDNAKTARRISFDNISKLREADTLLDLKLKAIDYLNEASNFYENYYAKFITLTKTPKDADSLSALQSLGKEIKVLMHKDSVCIEARKLFREKYGIQDLN